MSVDQWEYDGPTQISQCFSVAAHVMFLSHNKCEIIYHSVRQG